MINESTVLVLGAGASCPYLFPSGPELARKVADEAAQIKFGHGNILQQTAFSRAVLEAFPDPDGTLTSLMMQFAKPFNQSGCESLDEFVQSPVNRRFLPFVKTATILQLLPHEHDKTLRPGNPSQAGDWIEYLFRHFLRTDDPSAFTDNRLKVITFNFDRSFERRLYLMLEASYGAEKAKEFAAHIPVLHVHGSLGGPAWLDTRPAESRPYTPDASREQKIALLDQIRIIHEDIDPRVIADARQWLTDAQKICFLGFGYHRLTMARLGLNERLPATIYGTTKGLSMPERARVLKRFGANQSFVGLEPSGELDARRYIRESELFQSVER